MKTKVGAWFMGTAYWIFATGAIIGAVSVGINGWGIITRNYQSDPEGGAYIIMALVFQVVIVLYLRGFQFCVQQAIKADRVASVSTQSEETP